MIDVHEHISLTTMASYDPSHTTVLRDSFARNMNRRFKELTRVIKKAVDELDCFGLESGIQRYQMTPPAREAFAFRYSKDKVNAFMDWLQIQVDKGILEVSQFKQLGEAADAAWINLYITDSYKRGVIRARQEMISGGMNIPTIEASGGILSVISTLIHVDRLGLLATRVFSDLKGVTTAMDTHISRILAQGIADGDNPRLLARKLVSTINGEGIGELGITDSLGRFIPAARRAEMIARTEILRSFNTAKLIEFKNWGIMGIEVLAEVSTARDDRVCNICQPLEGKVYTLEEASGLLPVHPLCRCTFLPFIPDIQKYR